MKMRYVIGAHLLILFSLCAQENNNLDSNATQTTKTKVSVPVSDNVDNNSENSATSSVPGKNTTTTTVFLVGPWQDSNSSKSSPVRGNNNYAQSPSYSQTYAANFKQQSTDYHNNKGYTWGEYERRAQERFLIDQAAAHYQAETQELMSRWYIRQAVDAELAKIRISLEQALCICKAYTQNSEAITVEVLNKQMELLHFTIADPLYQKHWMDVQYKITQIICDSEGKINYVQSKHSKRIQSIINDFQRDIDRLQDYAGTLARCYACRKENEVFYPPAIKQWLEQVRNHPDNKKFFELHAYLRQGDFKKAEPLVRSLLRKDLDRCQKKNKSLDKELKNVLAYEYYKKYFAYHYDKYGIAKRYSSHPAYKAVTQNVTINSCQLPVVREDLALFFEQAEHLEKHLQQSAQEFISNSPVIEARKAAFSAYCATGDVKTMSVIDITQEGKNYLIDQGVQPQFLWLSANALQRQAQIEFKDITEKAAFLYYAHTKDSNCAQLLGVNARLIQVGSDCIADNNIIQAQIIADGCYKLLDDIEKYVRNFTQGVAEGVANTVSYIKEHPIETAATIIAPEVMTPYHVAKIALNAVGYTYERLSQVDYQNLSTQKVVNKINEMYESLKAMPGPELVQRGTALGTQLWLDGKFVNKAQRVSKAILRNVTNKVRKKAIYTYSIVPKKLSSKDQKISIKPFEEIQHPVVNSKRVGSALKEDKYHMFNDVIDNYARYAKEFNLIDNDVKIKGFTKTLYQIEGSLDGANGVFEWIVEYRPQELPVISHRLFINNGKITGIPNIFEKKK